MLEPMYLAVDTRNTFLYSREELKQFILNNANSETIQFFKVERISPSVKSTHTLYLSGKLEG